MFVGTVLAKDVVIPKAGGAGHENWGHPLEPTAQYDHVAPGRTKPPFCRWRLEVAAPLTEQTLFLHVFQVTQEGTMAMAPVKLLADKPQIRLEIGPTGGQWKVSLPTSGALTANVTPPGKPEIRMAASVELDQQYGQTPLKPTKR